MGFLQALGLRHARKTAEGIEEMNRLLRLQQWEAAQAVRDQMWQRYADERWQQGWSAGYEAAQLTAEGRELEEV